VTQLLVAGINQKSQTEPSYETPSTLCSPWVRILTLDIDSVTGGIYKLLFGLALMLISGKQDTRGRQGTELWGGCLQEKCKRGTQVYIYQWRFTWV